MASGPRRYGLILTSKKQAAPPKAASAFADSSSEDDETGFGRKHVNLSLQSEGRRKQAAKHTKESLSKALAQDPTVFQYDSVYEKMVEEKDKERQRILKDRKEAKPKYVHSLKKAAEKRKIVQDIAYERKVQREMESDENKFEDKESFVTAAYKKTLEERKEMEETLRKEEELDRINDVRKQDDLNKFYRHLLMQKSGETAPDKKQADSPLPTKQEKISMQETCIIEQEESHSAEEHSAEETSETQQNLEVASSDADTDEVHATKETQDNTQKPTESEAKPFAKRTSEQSFESARERYLARKKAKTMQTTSK